MGKEGGREEGQEECRLCSEREHESHVRRAARREMDGGAGGREEQQEGWSGQREQERCSYVCILLV